VGISLIGGLDDNEKGRKKKNIRFLAMARHGLDQVAFVSPFLVSQSGEFRKLWGGFAPKSSASFRELAKERLGQCKAGGIFL
jgi:hypothetical protein